MDTSSEVVIKSFLSQLYLFLNSYEIQTGPDKQESVQQLKIRLERTVDWLKSSGLKVNEENRTGGLLQKRH